jgi:hypothetical protein
MTETILIDAASVTQYPFRHAEHDLYLIEA